jgi:hypothetical protein
MSERPLWSTLRNLALALLNATLILAALVLWLAWRTADRVHEVTEDFDIALVEVAPLGDGLRALTAEVAGLRADLEALKDAPAEGVAAIGEDLALRLDTLESRIAMATGRVDALLLEPEVLIDRAIDASAEEMKEAVADLRGCTLPTDA